MLKMITIMNTPMKKEKVNMAKLAEVAVEVEEAVVAEEEVDNIAEEVITTRKVKV
jgi:hypothetical protein